MVRFEFRPYCRPFRQPLQTHHGQWRDRRGIILRLSANNRVGWGEIAPIEAFATETWEEAMQFCQSLPTELGLTNVSPIPAQFPACQFGVASAWEWLQEEPMAIANTQPISYLLPTGEPSLTSWRSAWEAGYRTFKWKIAVTRIEQELEWFAELRRSLPATAQLRLDANGGLQWQQACRWLETCEASPLRPVEFLEQPLPPTEFDALLRLQHQYQTPIALDESVTTIAQLNDCYQRGWRGMFVIKPAIAGFPAALRQFCQQSGVEVVWSSALETAIARRFIQTRLIPSVEACSRAVGFGVEHWFGEDGFNCGNEEELWQRLAPT